MTVIFFLFAFCRIYAKQHERTVYVVSDLTTEDASPGSCRVTGNREVISSPVGLVPINALVLTALLLPGGRPKYPDGS